MSWKVFTTMSNVKDPENRSKKLCVCGNHSRKAKNAKRNRIRRINCKRTITNETTI